MGSETITLGLILRGILSSLTLCSRIQTENMVPFAIGAVTNLNMLIFKLIIRMNETSENSFSHNWYIRPDAHLRQIRCIRAIRY